MYRNVTLHIDPNICKLCERCLAAKSCRTKAIVQIDPGEIPFLEADRCRDCWACIAACPYGAVRKISKAVGER